MNISEHILESALAALRVNKNWNCITEDTKQIGRLVVHIGNAVASYTSIAWNMAAFTSAVAS